MNYIFDFDGTLADSLPAMIGLFNKVIRGNDDPLTAAEVQALRGMSSHRAIRQLGVRWWQVPKLLLRALPDFQAMAPRLDSFTGLHEVIRQMYERGDKLYIVTSNTRESVDRFLKAQKLDAYFTDVVTGAGLFKKSKHIRRLMRDHKLKRKETVYIGDETRDIQAARLAFIKPVSVTWGFNTRAILKRQRPAYLIDDPKELLTVGLKVRP